MNHYEQVLSANGATYYSLGLQAQDTNRKSLQPQRGAIEQFRADNNADIQAEINLSRAFNACVSETLGNFDANETPEPRNKINLICDIAKSNVVLLKISYRSDLYADRPGIMFLGDRGDLCTSPTLTLKIIFDLIPGPRYVQPIDI